MEFYSPCRTGDFYLETCLSCLTTNPRQIIFVLLTYFIFIFLFIYLFVCLFVFIYLFIYLFLLESQCMCMTFKIKFEPHFVPVAMQCIKVYVEKEILGLFFFFFFWF